VSGVVETKQLAAMVPVSLLDELSKLAKANERSVSAEARLAIKAHVEASKRDAA
jgi:hypothetical protein